MPSAKRPIPKLRCRKDGLYAVRLNGRDHYLGRDEATATQQYHALIALWMAGGRRLSVAVMAPAEPEGMLIGELVLGYVEFAQTYYLKNGQPTNEVRDVRAAVRPLVGLFAELRADDFTPRYLLAVRRPCRKRTCASPTMTYRADPAQVGRRAVGCAADIAAQEGTTPR